MVMGMVVVVVMVVRHGARLCGGLWVYGLGMLVGSN